MLSRNMVWFPDLLCSISGVGWTLSGEPPNPIIPAVNVDVGNDVRLPGQLSALY